MSFKMRAALNASCPTCKAAAGDPCRSRSNIVTATHVGRIRRYKDDLRADLNSGSKMPRYINVYSSRTGGQVLGLPCLSRNHARGMRLENWSMKPVCLLVVYPKR